MSDKQNQLKSGELKSGISWNLVSFGVIAISGLLMNGLIGRFWGASVLGVFNQALAVYIVLSQFSVLGLHYWVLHDVSSKSHNERSSSSLLSALIIAFGVSALLSICAYFAAPLMTQLLGSSELENAFKLAFPGLVFFSVNKVALAYLNGLRRMKLFAILSAARYVLVVSMIGIWIINEIDPYTASATITLAEVILSSIIVFFLPWSDLKTSGLRGISSRVGGSLRFGFKAMWSGTIVELNSKVDILVLGIFLTDAKVGVYSIAAFLFEGIYQLAVAFRNNYNPLIGEYYAKGMNSELLELIKDGKKKFFLFSLACVSIGLALYFPACKLILGQEFLNSFQPFAILMGGFLLASPYIPFNMFLLQIGQPAYHSLYFLSILAANTVLNFALVPIMGTNGAALGTAVSLLYSAIFLRYIVRKRANILI